jgi:hypothetical protein
MALVSGLCVGGGLVGAALDLVDGVAPLWNVLGLALMYVLVSAPFLAGGIALIVWAAKARTRK